MTTPLPALKPCPFCGHVGLDFAEGSTFRWGVASCGGCGASTGETRINTMAGNRASDDSWHADAIKEWNTRAALDAAEPAEPQPVAWGQLGTLNGRTYLRQPYDRTPYPPPADVVRNLNLVPLYAAAQPASAPVALTDEQITEIFERAPRWHYPPIGATDREFARDIESAVLRVNGIAPAAPTPKES